MCFNSEKYGLRLAVVHTLKQVLDRPNYVNASAKDRNVDKTDTGCRHYSNDNVFNVSIGKHLYKLYDFKILILCPFLVYFHLFKENLSSKHIQGAFKTVQNFKLMGLIPQNSAI